MAALEGRRIIVTRDEAPDGPLCALLRREGAAPLLRSTLEVVPLSSPAERWAEIRRLLPGARWLVVTSPRAVRLLRDCGVFDAPPPEALQVAVAGARTRDAVREAGWPVAVTPDQAGAAPLLEALLAADEDRTPGRVVFPASARAGGELPAGLRQAGYPVDILPLYGPRPAPPAPRAWESLLETRPHAITFTSPSAVEGLLASAGEPRLLDGLRALPAAVQGPTTGAACLAAGWTRVAEAEPRTFPGLVRALTNLLNHPTGVPE